MSPPLRVDRAEDPPGSARRAGRVDPAHEVIRVRWAAALARKRLGVQAQDWIERMVGVDLNDVLRLPDPTPDVVLELAANAVEIGEIVDAVGVPDGRFEAGPVEREPVRQARREAHAEEIDSRQQLDHPAEQFLLRLEPARVLAFERGQPGAERLREMRLHYRRHAEAPALHVWQARDHLVAPSHHGCAPTPRRDAVEPPRLLEDRVDPWDRVARRPRWGHEWVCNHRMSRHVLSSPKRRSCASHHAADRLPITSATP